MPIKRNHIVMVIFFIIIYGMLLGLFLYKDNKPIEDFLTKYRTDVLPNTPIAERVESAVDIAEDTVYEETYGKEFFVEQYGLIQRLIGKHIISDAGYGEIYKTKHNQIIFKINKKDKDVKKAYIAVKTLHDELAKAGIPFLYVQAPFKLSDEENQLPANKIDYVDYNVDKFLALLKESDIDYLDLRPMLRDGSKTQRELFFDTDHHWRIETAFDATGMIEEKLNSDYGFEIEDRYRNIENFKLETTKNCYLGSMGRRTGRLYAGLDDFTLITPKFDTAYTLIERDYGNEVIYEGSFEDAILDKKYMGNKDSSIKLNRYAVYHGDNEELVFKNHLVDKGKVMLIKDSFGIPVYSFMSLGVSEIRALDMRLFKRSVSKYAVDNKPDIVILMYNGDAFNEIMYNFK